MTIIEDGLGSGRKAQINIGHELVVAAITESEEHRVSQINADAYFFSTGQNIDTLTLATTNDAKILFLQSLDPAKQLIVERILVSSDTDGIIIRFVKNYTVGTLTNNTVTLPSNMNFSSTRNADVNAHTWDEVGTTGMGGLTLGSTFKTFIGKVGPNIFPIDGVPVLDQNDNIGIEILNPTGGAVEVEVGIRFYLE
jgi:hypothetical protein